MKYALATCLMNSSSLTRELRHLIVNINSLVSMTDDFFIKICIGVKVPFPICPFVKIYLGVSEKV